MLSLSITDYLPMKVLSLYTGLSTASKKGLESLYVHKSVQTLVSCAKETFQIGGVAFLSGIICAMILSTSWDVILVPSEAVSVETNFIPSTLTTYKP